MIKQRSREANLLVGFFVVAFGSQVIPHVEIFWYFFEGAVVLITILRLIWIFVIAEIIWNARN